MSDLSVVKNAVVADLESAGSALANFIQHIPAELQAEFTANVNSIKSSADTLATTTVESAAAALNVPTLGPIAASYVVKGVNAAIDELGVLLKQVQPMATPATAS